MLQCLQRLCASSEAAEALLSCHGVLGRAFAAYECGQEHVAIEAGRLLLRMWAPWAAKVGAGETHQGATCV